ncbi:hypothetical protein AX16_004770 [Volvariella volvacea WC 439]|nr:hypothetical protein AX16_004770 [Volvariella volvacea WC 439]
MTSVETTSSTTKPTIAVIGTCDTKLVPLNFLKQGIISDQSCNAILIDIGTYAPEQSVGIIDIERAQVLHELTKAERADLVTGDRGSAMAQMTLALSRLLKRLHQRGAISGVVAAGGSGNTTVCTQAFLSAPLPIGFPKLMVSTLASGDVSCYVGETDLTMMYSVVDVAGMNQILASVLENGAHAIIGMAQAYHRRIHASTQTPNLNAKPTIAITMFGVTTPCVQHAESRLLELGYDVVVFHATGSGGRAMERLISEGKFQGVLDLTTTELADELVGGVLTAGPNRLEAAAKAGIPQVISVGALDMVNFGPRSTVPSKFHARNLYEHNATITLMRTTVEECASLGRILGEKANLAQREKVKVILPTKGISLLSEDEKPFHDQSADDSLMHALKNTAKCDIVMVDASLNDQAFANKSVELLVSMM